MAWTDFGYNFTQSLQPDSIITSSQAPWTAARCQRLLRPLSAKIGLLRKEKQSTNAKEDFRQAQKILASSEHHRPALSFGKGRWKSDKIGNAANEEWAPNPRPPKRIKRTYSSRNSSSQYRSDPSQPSATDQPIRNQSEISIPSALFGVEARPDGEADAGASSQDLDGDQRDEGSEIKPLIQRGGNHDGRSSQSHLRSRYNCTISFERKLTSGIHKGVDALLKATEKQETRQNGARSLFATCLRKVPKYIAQEELWNGPEDPKNNIDVSSIVYNDLETLSTCQANGWDPLRQVVRAHGICMVGNAVSEGLIESNAFHDIVSLCLRLNAYDEAQHLLERMIASMEPLQTHPKIRSNLKVLDGFVLATGRHSFRYKTLVRLLGSGGLPPDWISRPDTVDTWNKVVQSVSQQDEHARDAAELLRLAITMTYGLACHDPARFVHGIRLRRSRLLTQANEYFVGLEDQITWPRGSRTATLNGERDSFTEKTLATTSSLMTVLCAIGLLRSAATVSGPSRSYGSSMNALQEVTTDAQQVLELTSERISMIRSQGVAVPLLAAGLVKATLCHSRREFTQTIPTLFDRLMGLERDECALEECSSFLCAVAECCAKATCTNAFDHIQKIVHHIHHIASSLKPVSTSYEFCNRIGVAAALEYAETTNHPKHLHWALDVEQSITGAPLESARRTPAKILLRGQAQAQAQNGYRWEAGICEWVARTPAIALRKLQVQECKTSFTQSKGRMSATGSASTQDASSRLGSSPCSSSEPSSMAHDRLELHGLRNLRGSRSHGTTQADKADEYTTSDRFISHIQIEDDGDELSMSDSSQETHAEGAGRLQMVTNVAAKLNQRPAGKEQRSETYKRRGIRCRTLGLDEAPRIEAEIVAEDISLDSEDELSFL